MKTRELHKLIFFLGPLLLSGGPLHGSGRQAPAGYIRRDQVVFRSTGALEEDTLRTGLPDSVECAAVPEVLDSLQRKLHAGLGYHRARLERVEWLPGGPGKSGKRLAVRVEQGPPTRLGRLGFPGLNARQQEALRRSLGPLEGVTASDRAVERILRRVVGYYADRGHPFCAVRILEVELLEDSRLGLAVQVEMGRPVSLGMVTFSGAEHTRPEVMEKLSRLVPGQSYSESGLSSARRRLLRSGLFRTAAGPLVLATSNPHRVDLELHLEELPANRVEAALGSGRGAGPSSLAGFVRLHLGNLFGTARACLVDWERPRENWSSLQLEYREPWLPGLDLSLEAGYGQQVRDSTYTTSSGRVRLAKRLTERLELGLAAVYEKTSPGSETYPGAESSRHWSVGGTLDWSSVLRPLNPASGLELSSSAAAGRRRLEGRDLREVRLSLHGACYLPLGRTPHLAALGVGYAQVSVGRSGVGEIPYHARLPIGGAAGDGSRPTVRGHVEEAWRGRKVAWANLEYRYLAGENSRLFVFYDIGAAQVPASRTPAGAGPVPEEPGWRTQALQGIGAGLQLESRLGLVGIAVGFDPERGLGQGRLHLSLAERF
ncbi:MAG: BamA/TamA family outer membrane protein [Candidatus Glassbacteria bacterium]|nr:BamA/TamA family outer membrane protein [Candidatus Glassbacteria bacterium]